LAMCSTCSNGTTRQQVPPGEPASMPKRDARCARCRVTITTRAGGAAARHASRMRAAGAGVRAGAARRRMANIGALTSPPPPTHQQQAPSQQAHQGPRAVATAVQHSMRSTRRLLPALRSETLQPSRAPGASRRRRRCRSPRPQNRSSSIIPSSRRSSKSSSSLSSSMRYPQARRILRRPSQPRPPCLPTTLLCRRLNPSSPQQRQRLLC
jgi:hypothetical protein